MSNGDGNGLKPRLSVGARLGVHYDQWRQALRNFSGDLRVSGPGIIQSFDPAKQTATVQLSIRENLIRGQKMAPEAIPLLVDVPIVMPRAGNFALTMPVTAGDEVLMVFGDRCMDDWWQNGGQGNQLSWRQHDLSDGYAVAGVWSQPNVLPSYSAATAQLRSKDASVNVEVTANNINNTATAAVNTTTANVTTTATGQISLSGAANVAIKSVGSILNLSATAGAKLTSSMGHMLDLSGASAVLKAAGGASAISLTGGLASVTGGLSLPSLPNAPTLATDGLGNFIAGPPAGGGGGGSFVAGGDLAGGATSQTVIGLQAKPLDAATVQSPSDGWVITWNAASGKYKAMAAVGNYVAGAGISIAANTISNTAPNVQSDWNASSGLAVILNKPTIPAAQVNSDWNAASGVAQILNRPNLATVATSGSYPDLINKPVIPPAITFAGDLSGSPTSQKVVGFQGKAADTSLGNPVDKQVVTYNAAAGAWQAGTFLGTNVQVNSDWAATGGVTQILNQPSISTDNQCWPKWTVASSKGGTPNYVIDCSGTNPTLTSSTGGITVSSSMSVTGDLIATGNINGGTIGGSFKASQSGGIVYTGQPFLSCTTIYGPYITGGCHYNGSAWVADAATAETLGLSKDGYSFSFNSGLTVGNTFSPTTLVSIDTTGCLFLPGAQQNTQLRFGTGTSAAGILCYTGAGTLHISSGVYYNGTAWIAAQTSGSFFRVLSNGVDVYSGSGFTVGSPASCAPIAGIYTTTASITQLQMGVAGAWQGCFLLGNTGACNVAGGAYLNSASQWVAASTSAGIFGIGGTPYGGGFTYYANSGLTVGAAFNVTPVFSVDGAGNITKCGSITCGTLTVSGSISITGGITSHNNLTAIGPGTVLVYSPDTTRYTQITCANGGDPTIYSNTANLVLSTNLQGTGSLSLAGNLMVTGSIQGAGITSTAGVDAYGDLRCISGHAIWLFNSDNSVPATFSFKSAQPVLSSSSGWIMCDCNLGAWAPNHTNAIYMYSVSGAAGHIACQSGTISIDNSTLTNGYCDATAGMRALGTNVGLLCYTGGGYNAPYGQFYSDGTNIWINASTGHLHTSSVFWSGDIHGGGVYCNGIACTGNIGTDSINCSTASARVAVTSHVYLQSGAHFYLWNDNNSVWMQWACASGSNAYQVTGSQALTLTFGGFSWVGCDGTQGWITYSPNHGTYLQTNCVNGGHPTLYSTSGYVMCSSSFQCQGAQLQAVGSNGLMVYSPDLSNYLQINCANGASPVVGSTTGNIIVGCQWQINGWCAANGFTCRNGISGGWTGNHFNFWYSGGYLAAYVDATSLGNIAFTSDYRLKENIELFDGALPLLNNLRVVKFDWRDIENDIFKSDGVRHVGLLAHEVQQLLPSAVVGEKDALTVNGTIQPQTFNWPDLMALLVRAVQELSIKVETLEARSN